MTGVVKVKDATGQTLEVDAGEAQAGVAAGRYRLAENRVRVVAGNNRSGTVDAANFAAAAGEGWRLASEQDAQAATLRRDASGVGGTIRGGVEAAARGASLGASDLVQAAFGADTKGIQARKDALGDVGTALEVGGAIAATVGTAGLGGAAQGVARGGLAARGLAGVARTVSAPSRMVAELGGLAEARILGGAAEATLGRRVVASATGEAIDGALGGLGGAVSEAVIADKEVSAEAILGGALAGAAFGGGLGGAGRYGSELAGETLGRMLRGASPGTKEADDSMREVLARDTGVDPASVPDGLVEAAWRTDEGALLAGRGLPDGVDPAVAKRVFSQAEAEPEWAERAFARRESIEREVDETFTDGMAFARGASEARRRLELPDKYTAMATKALPKNSDFVSPRVTETLRRKLEGRVAEMQEALAQPDAATAYDPAAVRKAQRYVTRALDDALDNGDGTAGAVRSFRAMERLERDLAKLADVPESESTAKAVREMAGEVRAHLQREDLWGEAGIAQREISDAAARADEAEVELQRGGGEAGKLEAALEAQANYYRTAAKHYELPPEHVANLREIEETIPLLGERFREQRRVVEFLDDVDQLREARAARAARDEEAAAEAAGNPALVAGLKRYGKFLGGDEQKFGRLGELLSTEEGQKLILSNLDEAREVSARKIADAATDANEAVDLAVRESSGAKLKKLDELLKDADKPKREKGRFARGARGYALEHLRKQGEEIAAALNDPLLQPSLVSDYKKAIRINERALEKAESIKKASQAFRAIDEYKRELDVMARGRFNEYKRNASPETLETAKRIDSLASDSRSHLEAEDIYGEAATVQRDLNAAISKEMRAMQALKAKSPALAKMLERGSVADTDTALQLARMHGRTKGAAKTSALDEAIDARLEYLRTARELLDLSPDAIKRIDEAERAVDAMRGQLKEQAKVAEAAELMQHARSLEGGNSPSITVMSTLGPAAGAGLGFGLGGLPGALVGGLLGSVTRPFTTARSMAAVLTMSRKFGMKFDGKQLVQRLRSRAATMTGAAAAGSRRAFARARAEAVAAGRSGVRAAAFEIGAATPEERADQVRKVSKRVVEMSSPESLRRAMGPELEALAAEAPETAAAIEAALGRAAAFLQSKLPTMEPPGPFGGGGYVNPLEVDRWLRYRGAVVKPGAVVGRLYTGTITHEDVEALRAVYPKHYEQLARGVMDALADAADSGRAVPYESRVALGRLLDLPLDPAQAPDRIAAVQAMFGPSEAPTPDQAPAPQQIRKGAGKLDPSKLATASQAVASR